MSTYPANGDLPVAPTHRYLLDEASGNALDSVASNDLTDNATVGAGTGYTDLGATFDNSRDFESGNSEFFEHADNAEFDFTGAFTISAWVKPETNTSGTIVGKWVGPNKNYLFQLSSGKIQAIGSSDGSTDDVSVTGGTTLNTGTWYHVAVVYEPSTRLEVYVNGATDGTDSSSVPASLHNGSSAFRVGAHTGGAYYDGLMNDVILTKGTAYSDAQISDLYDLYGTAPATALGIPFFYQ